MINKILRFAVLLLAGFFISGCSDDDCPTCTQENPILFVCTASFRPEEPIDNPSELGVFAGFMSDPIPIVSRFAFMGNELEWTDGSLPSFSGDIESPYVKRVSIEIVADDHSTQFDIVIPDSFRLISPLSNVTAGQSLPFHWSRSADAENYGLRIIIVRLDSPDFDIELDTSISTQDTTFVLDATHVKANCDILLDLRASIGKSGGAGVETNFANGRLRGFVAGSYEAGNRVIRTIEPH